MGLFAATLAFYVFTLQPSLAWGDGTRLQREAITGESFILAEMVQVDFAPDPFPFARLGVAAWDHPLWVMIGYALAQALPGVASLWLVNFVSALFAAAAVVVVGLIVQAHSQSLPSAVLAAGGLAVSHTFWFHAVTPEVYTLLAFLLLAAVWAWLRHEQTGRPRWLFAAALAMGLAGSTHLLAFLAFPALAVYLLLARWADRARGQKGGGDGLGRDLIPRRLAQAGLVFLVGFLPYLIQLMRLLRTFPLREVMGPAIGATFLSGLVSSTALDLLASLLTLAGFTVLQFNPVGAMFGLIGLWRGIRVSPGLWRLAVAGLLIYGLFGVLYRVADQFAFFQTTYLFFALLMGLGLAYVLRRWPIRRRIIVAVGALGVGVMPVLYGLAPGMARAAGLTDATLGIPAIGTGVRDGLAYYVNPNKRGDRTAEAFGTTTLANLPPNALVLAEWYTDTDEYFVLRYYVAVEGRRPDVEVVGWPTVEPFSFDVRLATDLVAAAIRERPVYLASLSEQYYGVSALAAQYCIVPEQTLYRVLPGRSADAACLTP